MHSNRSPSGLVLVLMLSIAMPAAAGNSRSFFLGDEAAMTAGAGIAVSADSGSLWYNPAGLGGLNLGRMELTGTVYSAKLRAADGILDAELPSGHHSADTRADDFGSVPTSLVFVRHGNDKISYGLAWYQTEDLWLDFRSDMNVPFDDSGARWTEGFEYHQRGYVYHIGPSIGVQLHPRFRIGGSLYFVYRNVNSNLRAFMGLTDPNTGTGEDEVLASSLHFSTMDLGMMFSLGVQWEPIDRLHIGAVLRTPTFAFWYSEDASSLDVESVLDDFGLLSTQFSYSTVPDSGFTFEQTVPMEVQIGVVYRKDRSWIGLEGAVRPPLDDRNQAFLWNASLGGRLALTPVLSWGAGIFTDNSSLSRMNTVLDWRSDRYGFTTGVEFRTPLTVKTRPKKKKRDEKDDSPTEDPPPEPPKERTLTWATTLALSYSFELAEYQTLSVDIDADPQFQILPRKGVFHQGFIYLGTALYF